MPSVLSYIHNIGRSAVYTTVDALKDMNPALKSFAETNSELTRQLVAQTKKSRTSSGDMKSKILNNEYVGLVKEAKDNFLSDLKTGNFYNRERVEKYSNDMMKNMGFDFDDSFDDVTVGENVASWEQTEEITAQMDNVGAKIADATAKVSLKSAQYISASTKDSARVLHEDLKNAIHQNNIGLNAINSTLTNVMASTEAVSKIMSDSIPKMFEQLATGQQKTNDILTEMLTIQKEDRAKKNEIKINEAKDYNYATNFDGLPDIKKYSEVVLKNLKDTIDEMTAGALSMGESMAGMASAFGSPVDMMRQFIASPISSLMEMGVKQIIPGVIKTSMEEFNETMKGMFGSFIMKMNQLADDSWDNFWLEKIGKIFGIKGSLRESLSTGSYEKGKVDFDGITRKSIIHVIPTYLSQIVALLGGPNRRYDFQSGKFLDAKEIRKKKENITKDHAASASRDVRAEFDNYARGINFGSEDRKKEFNKSLDNFFTELYRSGELFDYNNKSAAELARKYKISKNDMNLIISMFRLNAKNGKGYKNLQLNGNIMKERSAQNERMQRMDQAGDSVLLNLFDNSGIAEKLNKENKNALENRDQLSPLNVLDNKGHNQFWYMQQYYRQFERVISILGGIYTNPDVKGGANPVPPKPNGPQIIAPNGKSIHASNRESRTQSSDEVPPSTNGMDERIYAAIHNTQYGRDDDVHAVIDQSEEYRARIKAEEERLEKERKKEEEKQKKKTKRNNDKINSILGTRFGEEVRAISDEDKITLEDTLIMDDDAAQRYFEYQLQHMVVDRDNIEKEKMKKPNLLQRLRNANSLSEKGMTILDSIERVAKAPTKVLANVLHKADERMYQLIYGKDGRADDPDQKSFFRTMMDNMREQFRKVSSWIDTNILDPLSEKFNKDSIKDGLKNFFAKFGIDLDDIAAKIFGEKDENGVRSGGLLGDVIQNTKEEFKKAWAWVKDAYKTVGEDLFGSEIFDEYRKSDENTLKSVLEREARERAEALEKANAERANTKGKILSDLGITTADIENNFMKSDDEKDVEAHLLELERMPKIFEKYNYNKDELLPFDKIKEYIVESQKQLAETVPDYINNPENVYSDNKIKSLIDNSLIDISRNLERNEELGIKMTQDKAMEYIKRQVDKQTSNAASNLFEAQSMLNNKLGTNSDVLSQNKIDELIETVKNDIKAKTEKEESKEEVKVDESGAEPAVSMAKGGRVRKTGLAALTKGELVLPPNIDFYGSYAEGTEGAGMEGEGETSASEELKKHKVKFGDRADLKLYAHAVGKELSNFFKAGKEALFGSRDENEKNNFNEMMDDVFANIGQYAPKMIAGGVIGGGVSLVGGLVGGPLLGAALGAATGLAMKSQKVQDWLFGNKLDDGSYTGGMFNAEIATFIKTKFPNIAKYGVVGALTGLSPFIPGGPLTGLIVGAGIGFMKNSDRVQQFLFNTEENGQDGLLDMTQQDFTDKVKKALPRMGAGAALGLLAGPFGLVGNIFMGSALGWASTTDKYKNFMFGEEDINGERHGGVLGTIKEEVIDPLKDYLKDAKDKVVYFVNEKLIAPVVDAIKPITRFIQIGVQQLFKGITLHLKHMFTEYLGAPINKFLRHKVIKPLSGVIRKVLGTVTKPAKWLISRPSAMVGRVGKAIKKSQIKHGYADYMTAAERNDFRADNGMKFGDKFARFDKALEKMSPEDLKYVQSAFAYMNNPDKESKKAAKEARKKVNDALFNTEEVGFDNARYLFNLFKDGRMSRLGYALDGLNIGDETKQKLKDLIEEQGAIYTDATGRSEKTKDKQKRFEHILKTYGIKDIEFGESGNVWKYQDLLKREIKARGKGEKSTEEQILDNDKEQHHDIVTRLDKMIYELVRINDKNFGTEDAARYKAGKKDRKKHNRTFFGWDPTTGKPFERDKEESEEETTEEENSEETVEGHARGGTVKKTGVAMLTKGEMVIPVEHNPYYHGHIDPKNVQIKKEQEALKRFIASGANLNNVPYYGGYAKGGIIGGLLDKAKEKIAGKITDAAKGVIGNKLGMSNASDTDEAQEIYDNIDSQDEDNKKSKKSKGKGIGGIISGAIASAGETLGKVLDKSKKDDEGEGTIGDGVASNRETHVTEFGPEQYVRDRNGDLSLDMSDSGTRETQAKKEKRNSLLERIANRLEAMGDTVGEAREQAEDKLANIFDFLKSNAGKLLKGILGAVATIGAIAADLPGKIMDLITGGTDPEEEDPETTFFGLLKNMRGNLPKAWGRRTLKNLINGKKTWMPVGQAMYDTALGARNKIVDTTEKLVRTPINAAKNLAKNVKNKASNTLHSVLDMAGMGTKSATQQWIEEAGEAGGREFAERFTIGNRTLSAATVEKLAEAYAKATGSNFDNVLFDMMSGSLELDTVVRDLGQRGNTIIAQNLAEELAQSGDKAGAKILRQNVRYNTAMEAKDAAYKKIKDRAKNIKDVLRQNTKANTKEAAAEAVDNSKIKRWITDRYGFYGQGMHEAAELSRVQDIRHTKGLRFLDRVAMGASRVKTAASNTLKMGKNATAAVGTGSLFKNVGEAIQSSNNALEMITKSFKAMGSTYVNRIKGIISFADDMAKGIITTLRTSKLGLKIGDIVGELGYKAKGVASKLINKTGKVGKAVASAAKPIGSAVKSAGEAASTTMKNLKSVKDAAATVVDKATFGFDKRTTSRINQYVKSEAAAKALRDKGEDITRSEAKKLSKLEKVARKNAQKLGRAGSEAMETASSKLRKVVEEQAGRYLDEFTDSAGNIIKKTTSEVAETSAQAAGEAAIKEASGETAEAILKGAGKETAEAAVKESAEEAAEKAFKQSSDGVLTKLFKKLGNKLPGPVQSALAKLTPSISAEAAKNGAKSPGKLMKMFSPPTPADLVFAVADFMSGWSHANSIFGVTKNTYELTTGHRIIAGLVQAILGLKFFTALISPKWLVQFFVDHLSGPLGIDTEKLQEAQANAKEEVEQWNATHGEDEQMTSVEMYNKEVNGELSIFEKIGRSEPVQAIKNKIMEVVTPIKDGAIAIYENFDSIWAHTKLKAEQLFNNARGTTDAFNESKANGLEIAKDDPVAGVKVAIDKGLEMLSIPLFLPIRLFSIVGQGISKHKDTLMGGFTKIFHNLQVSTVKIWKTAASGNIQGVLNISNNYERPSGEEDSIPGMVTELGTMIQILPATAFSVVAKAFHFVKDHFAEIAEKLGRVVTTVGVDVINTAVYAYQGDWKSYFDFKADNDDGTAASNIQVIARAGIRLLSLPEAVPVAILGIITRTFTKLMEKLRDISGTEEEVEEIKKFEKAEGDWTWSDYFKTFSDKNEDGDTASTITMFTRKATRILYTPIVLVKRIFYTLKNKFGSVGEFIRSGVNTILSALGIGDKAKSEDGQTESEISAWDTFEKSGAASGIMSAIKGALDFASSTIGGVVKFITGTITDLKDSGTLDKIGDTITSIGTKVADVAANVFSFIGGIFEKVVPPITTFVEGATIWLATNVFDLGVDSAVKAFNVWPKAIVGDVKGVIDANKNIKPEDGKDSLGSKIASVVNGIQGACALVVASIINVLKNIATKGVSMLTSFVATLVQIPVDIANTFTYGFKGDWKTYFDFKGETDAVASPLGTVTRAIIRVIGLPFAGIMSIYGSIARKISGIVSSLKNLTGTAEEVAEIDKFEKNEGDMTWSKYFAGISVSDNGEGDLLGAGQILTRAITRILYSPIIFVKKVFNGIKDTMKPVGDFISKTIDSVLGFFGLGKKKEKSGEEEGLSAWDKFKDNPLVVGIDTILKSVFDVAGKVINGIVDLVGSIIDVGGTIASKAGDVVNYLAEKAGNLGDWFTSLFGVGSGSGSGLFKDPKGVDKLTNAMSIKEDATAKYREKVLEHLGAIASGSGLVGSGVGTKTLTRFSNNEDDGRFLSQRNSKYANTRFNTENDTIRQTISSDGCAPAAAAMAINNGAGKIGLKEAANYATSRGYKAQDSGTNANYFRDIWGNYGIESEYMHGNQQGIVDQLQSGNGVVLLGRDKNNRSKAISPFGPNNHYVYAKGIDENGNIIVNDPEAKRPDFVYSSKILNNVSLGIAAKTGSGAHKITRAINSRLFGNRYIGSGTLETNTANMIAAAEGDYTSVNPNDNGALSIGKIQWHASRALQLAKMIVDKNPSQAKSILSGTSLYSEITSSSTNWGSRKLNSTEVSAMKKLLATNESKQAQNELVAQDVPGYIAAGRSFGLTDEGALMYYSDLINQYGSGGAQKFVRAAISKAGSASKVTAQILHDVTMSMDSTYKTRRTKALNMITSGNIPDSGSTVSSSSSSSTSTSSDSSSSSESTKRLGILGDMDQLFIDMANTTIGRLLGMSESGSTDSSSDSSDSSSSSSSSEGAGANTPDEASLGAAIVAEARKYIGGKYVWGGKTLTAQGGVDCSGFVWRILEKFGYTGGYMTSYVGADSDNYGPKVNLDNIQAGDILFFKKSGQRVHHVGIASSNTMMVHAASSKTGIVENNFRNRGDLYCARRYPKSSSGKAYIASHGGASYIGSGSTANGQAKIKRRLNKMNNAAWRKNSFADAESSLNNMIKPKLPQVNLPSPKLPSSPSIKTASGSGLFDDYYDYIGSGTSAGARAGLLAKIKGISKLTKTHLAKIRKTYKLPSKINTVYRLKTLILKGYINKKDKKIAYKTRVSIANTVKSLVAAIKKKEAAAKKKAAAAAKTTTKTTTADSTSSQITSAVLDSMTDTEFIKTVENMTDLELDALTKKQIARYKTLRGLGDWVRTGSDIADYLSENGVSSYGNSLSLPDSEIQNLVKKYNLPSTIKTAADLEAAVPQIVKDKGLSSTIKNASELIDYLSESGIGNYGPSLYLADSEIQNLVKKYNLPSNIKTAEDLENATPQIVKDKGLSSTIKSASDLIEYLSEAGPMNMGPTQDDIDDYLSEAKTYTPSSSGFDWDDYRSEAKTQASYSTGFDWDDYRSEAKTENSYSTGFDWDDYNSEAKTQYSSSSGFDWDDYNSEAKTESSYTSGFDWDDYKSEMATPNNPTSSFDWDDYRSEMATPNNPTSSFDWDDYRSEAALPNNSSNDILDSWKDMESDIPTSDPLAPTTNTTTDTSYDEEGDGIYATPTQPSSSVNMVEQIIPSVSNNYSNTSSSKTDAYSGTTAVATANMAKDSSNIVQLLNIIVNKLTAITSNTELLNTVITLLDSISKLSSIGSGSGGATSGKTSRDLETKSNTKSGTTVINTGSQESPESLDSGVQQMLSMLSSIASQ